MNLAVSKVYKIDNTSVLSATTLGAGVVNSSLEVVGTINTGVWQGTAINDDYIDFIDNANKVKISALDIDAVAEIGTPIADGDLMIIDDGADGTNCSMTVDRMPVYTFSKVSGDILIDSTGVATIQTLLILQQIQLVTMLLQLPLQTLMLPTPVQKMLL